jgi:polyvinyl alcohol dehydrogenase (cytochrome)
MKRNQSHNLSLKLWLYFCFTCFAFTSVSAQHATSGTAQLYRRNCASCHDASNNSRIPKVSALRQMSAEAVLHSLEHGAMKPQAEGLTSKQKRALAEYVSGKRLQAHQNISATGKCSSTEIQNLENATQWNGWGADLSNTRFQSEKYAGLTESDIPKLKLQWAFTFPRQSLVMAQPAISGNQIYIGSAAGHMYSLNANTGCTYWSVRSEGGIRAAPTVVIAKDQKLVIFADLTANLYALEANTGKQIWRTKVEEFPGARISGSPQIYENVVYVPVSSVEENTSYDAKYECCRFGGSIVALDLKTGQQIWKTYTIPDSPAKTKISSNGTQLWGPSGAGIWSAPTLDPEHNLLYVTTGNNYSEPVTATSDAILALEMKTGKIIWTRQITAQDIYNGNCETQNRPSCPSGAGPDSDFGGPAILRTLPSGKRLLIASQKSAVVTALDPDNQGEIVWQTRIGRGGPLGGIEWGSSADAEHVYAPLSDTNLAPKKDDDPDLSPNKGGGVFALDLATGKTAWHSTQPSACSGRQHCGPANSAPTTVIPGVVFAGAVDGHIRAYSTHDGRILWDYNTAHAYHAVNGVPNAKGGSIDSAGPVVAGGKLFVVSGYSLWGGQPGNVLLVFSVEGR